MLLLVVPKLFHLLVVPKLFHLTGVQSVLSGAERAPKPALSLLQFPASLFGQEEEQQAPFVGKWDSANPLLDQPSPRQ